MRKFALVGLLVALVALVSTILLGGRELLPVTAWLLIPGGIGIFQAIRLLRHPEMISREQLGPTYDEVIAHGGVDMGSEWGRAASGETRLAVQNALDSFRRGRDARRWGISAAVSTGLGTLAWIVGAIASVVLGQDFASATLCLVAAVGFGTLTFLTNRLEKRRQTAERILEKQLLSLEVSTEEETEATRPPSLPARP